jgi:hypothetical protein
MQIIREKFAPELLTTSMRINDTRSNRAVSCRENSVVAGSKNSQGKDALYITFIHLT